MITALAGGVGAAKLLTGLIRVVPPEEISVITNTGDDIVLFGLYISPDTDITIYSLAGVVNPQTGWGIENDTFHCFKGIQQLGGEGWFNLGDRDLATHIWRTALLRQGVTLSEITERMRQLFGLAARIIPMTDSYVPTRIVTDEGVLHFQEYLVKRRAEPRVKEIYFENINAAKPSPATVSAIGDAEMIIVCPSNPLISIGPILAVPGMRDLLRQTRAKVVAVSPVVGGKSLKGPTDRMLADLGYEVSALKVAGMYQDFLDVYIIDEQDAALRPALEALGVRVVVAQTVMLGIPEKVALAGAVLAAGKRVNRSTS
ncbi:MAG: 2-phospho-L-lactate transferase [Pyrinomonadaceae bacterium]